MGNIIGLTDFMLTRLIAVVIITPVFIITGLLVGVVGGWCSQIYIAAQLPVKRQ
jgi:ABC-type transporter Mla maintaining outer membrane lipid asymmetry permease subunit MlaE